MVTIVLTAVGLGVGYVAGYLHGKSVNVSVEAAKLVAAVKGKL